MITNWPFNKPLIEMDDNERREALRALYNDKTRNMNPNIQALVANHHLNNQGNQNLQKSSFENAPTVTTPSLNN